MDEVARAPRWEYRVDGLTLSSASFDELHEVLAEAGAKGWELVTVTPFKNAMALVYKRPAPHQPSA